MKNYNQDKRTKTYYPIGEVVPFNYSDGEDVEAELYDIILNAKDLSLGSSELNEKIKNWTDRYHLSAQRADLLRPLSHLLNGDILEVGCGCGAITRYLGESGNNIIAVEGSKRRADIASRRCGDLKNVKIYCDNFIDFQIKKKFDIVTFIGVMEYSKLFVDSDNPVQTMLQKAKKLLKPKGALIIAIENQLGLKYFAGAPEDHLGKAYAGIENKYDNKSPVTFGKKNIEEIILKAGFTFTEFLYPFPDYKLPSLIITEQGAQDKILNLSDIVKFKTDHNYNGYQHRSFNLEYTTPLIIKNGLIEDLANSFLIIAKTDTGKKVMKNHLCYSYSSQRKKEFCKANTFLINGKDYIVKKDKLHPSVKSTNNLLKQKLTDENYIQGRSYLNTLEDIVNKSSLTVEQIVSWAEPWFLYLKKQTVLNNNNYLELSGEFIDAIPQNFIINEKNECQPYDLEWKYEKPIKLSYVLFRGLINAFNSLIFDVPNNETINNICDLTLTVVNKLLPDEKHELSSFVKSENLFLKHALGPDNLFDSVINQPIKQMPVQNIENARLKINKIEPVDEIKVQVFWAGNDCAFSETESVNKFIFLNKEKQNFVLYLPPINKNIEYIRFDISDKVGVLNIHNIIIHNSDNFGLWNWNKNEIKYKNDVLFIESKEYFQEKTIQLSTSNDPNFTIHVQNVTNDYLTGGLIIEMELSSLSEKQFELLNRIITKPLSFISSLDLLTLQTNIESAASVAVNLKNEITTLNNLIETKHKFIEELNNDKHNLVCELNEKNETIRKLFFEKEKILKTLSDLEKNLKIINEQTKHLENTLLIQIENNKKLIAEKENKDKTIDNLENNFKIINDKNINLEKTLTIQIENNKNLIAEKEKISVNLIAVNKTLQETITQKGLLISTLENQQNHINNINKEKHELHNFKDGLTSQISSLKIELNKLNIELDNETEKNKNLQNTNENLSKKIAYFIENYERKSLFQLIKNKILKKIAHFEN